MSELNITSEKGPKVQEKQTSMADAGRESTFSLSVTTNQDERASSDASIEETHQLVPRTSFLHPHLPRFEDYHLRERTSKTIHDAVSSEKEFWARLTGRNRRERGEHIPGWVESSRNIATSSYLNYILIFVPFAWVAHFLHWNENLIFGLCFVAIIPLAKLFEWGGEQMDMYLGKDLGDLMTVTLNNAIEATLAIILLMRCELRLLQSVIVGVVILHLLLIPGTSFLVGGARVLEQELHSFHTQLNWSLLTIGVLTIFLPTAFFAALDRGIKSISDAGELQFDTSLVNDEVRGQLLRMSRGLAVMLLIVYICSRIFLTSHGPPGEGGAGTVHELAPVEHKKKEKKLKHDDTKANPWACIILLVFTIGIMATTAEFLVESAEKVRERGHIQEEWFGLVILPLVSFSADGFIAAVYFIRSVINHILRRKPIELSTLAKARAIDLSIQFTLFWVPLLVLLAWWISKPFHLMFDYFEVAMLLGSCFLVNYVTADSKTNWVEGLILVVFYMMIATCAWFYRGQEQLELMLVCTKTVAEALISNPDMLEHAAAAAGEH
ncbi:hypothetical protein NLI96_g2549 [Meripilus lineatus]|uniref:Sodium/calcium exchanger membrane region domain-containing protein n=1 Tax=Meripilus lineatus TaxID=2056292 RepID=A0AAD5VAJ8_9APHY|nr:hypothetical protein NLI96_g2549 [Physisporinus lineatus]